MDQNTAYQYKALNEDSYNSLAAFAVSTPATVTLHPGLLTIVITGDDANEVGKFIDSEGLDFHINPIEFHDETLGAVIDCETTDAGTLRKIIYRMMGERSAMEEHHNGVLAEITAQRDSAKKDRDMYMRWYSDSTNREDRVKGQVRAIALLLNEIFPEK